MYFIPCIILQETQSTEYGVIIAVGSKTATTFDNFIVHLSSVKTNTFHTHTNTTKKGKIPLNGRAAHLWFWLAMCSSQVPSSGKRARHCGQAKAAIGSGDSTGRWSLITMCSWHDRQSWKKKAHRIRMWYHVMMCNLLELKLYLLLIVFQGILHFTVSVNGGSPWGGWVALLVFKAKSE